MERELHTINKLFFACDGKWQMPPFTTPDLVSRAQVAFERINSGLELLKNAVVEAEHIDPEAFHNSIEIYISALGKSLRGQTLP